MTFEDKIKIIPIDQPFLRVLAQYIADKYRELYPDYSKLLVIFPSQRNKFYFRRYLLEASHSKGIIPPQMKTVAEFLECLYESGGGKRNVLLGQLERNVLLKKAADDLKIEFWRELPFLRFISIGNRLLAFFDELTKEEITLEQIEKIVDLGHYPAKYVENELPILGKIYKRYRELLAAEGYHDSMDKYRAIAQQSRVLVQSDYLYICVAGIVAATRIEEHVIRNLLGNNNGELILHSEEPNAIANHTTTDSPYYLHNRLLKNLGVDSSGVTMLGQRLPSDAKPVIHIKSASTAFQQACFIEQAISEAVKNYPDLHRVAVVLPDENIICSVSEILKALGVNHNISAGRSLAHSLLYSFLHQLNAVIASRYHYEEFFGFIHHPLLKNAVVAELPLRFLVYSLENLMIRERLNYFDPNFTFASEFQPLVNLLVNCFSKASAKVNLSAYIAGMIDLINHVLTLNQDFVKANTPGVAEFINALHDLSLLRVSMDNDGSGLIALEFILRILKDESFQVQGDPMSGIQVIGLLEARNLDFDCLILPAMNETIFPRRSEKDLFINSEVRQKSGLHYNKERENLYHYYFNELINGKKEVYISYTTENKGDIPSRFVSILIAEGVPKKETPMRLRRYSLSCPERTVKKDKNIIKYLQSSAQNPGFSPSALNQYKTCSYSYFLKYIVGVSEPDKIVEEPDSAIWGSITHSAIRNFYKYDFPRGIKESEFEKAKAALESQFDNAIMRNRDLALRPMAITFLDAMVYKRRLVSFLHNEINRFKEGFEIFKAALEREAKHHIVILGLPVRLYGYIDRIDLYNDKYHIIDYKTGRLPSKSDYQIGADFTAFQLPLYALVFSKEHFDTIGGMLYYQITSEAKTTDICKGMNHEDYLRDFKKEVLVPTITEILNPDKPFVQTVNQEACEYCAFINLCGNNEQ